MAPDRRRVEKPAETPSLFFNQNKTHKPENRCFQTQTILQMYASKRLILQKGFGYQVEY